MCMKVRRSYKFNQIRSPTAELAALERQKKTHTCRLIMGKTVLPLFLGCFDWILFILAGNDDIYKSL